jgi:hypothetical protein
VRLACVGATLAALLALADVRVARGAGSDCAGPWSLARPVPDICLEPIETDRPHLTETPHPVPAGHVQLESGIVAVELRGHRDRRVLLFDQMYKLGVADGADVELLVVHAEATRRGLAPNPTPLLARAKFALWREDGMIPSLTLVPIAAAPLRAVHGWTAGLLAFLAWELPARLELELNAGALGSFRGARAGTELEAALALTRNITGPLSAYVEIYGRSALAGGPSMVLGGAGLTLLVHRDIQLDTGTFLGVAGDVAPATPFVGISIRR